MNAPTNPESFANTGLADRPALSSIIAIPIGLGGVFVLIVALRVFPFSAILRSAAICSLIFAMVRYTLRLSLDFEFRCRVPEMQRRFTILGFMLPMMGLVVFGFEWSPSEMLIQIIGLMLLTCATGLLLKQPWGVIWALVSALQIALIIAIRIGFGFFALTFGGDAPDGVREFLVAALIRGTVLEGGIAFLLYLVFRNERIREECGFVFEQNEEKIIRTAAANRPDAVRRLLAESCFSRDAKTRILCSSIADRNTSMVQLLCSELGNETDLLTHSWNGLPTANQLAEQLKHPPTIEAINKWQAHVSRSEQQDDDSLASN